LFGLDIALNGANSNILSRTESILFLVILILYLYILISNANRKRKRQIKQEKYLQKEKLEDQPQEKDLKIWQIALYVVLGLAAVVFGGECVSTTAQFLAIKMGMSEALVGLTIVAVGTSLPELVTSVVAAKKGENDLALGNVVGSNIFNVLLILGSSAAICPIAVEAVAVVDMLILIVFSILGYFLAKSKYELSKKEGILFLVLYAIYFVYIYTR
jgi:cation:H+ antiporter